MANYRKKPVVIEAIQVKELCYDAMVQHFGEEPGNKYGFTIGTKHPFSDSPKGLLSSSKEYGFSMWIDTLEGRMIGSYEDWIIKGVQGEFYPCKPDIFEKTYEFVKDA
jgi:hypothetical protein